MVRVRVRVRDRVIYIYIYGQGSIIFAIAPFALRRIQKARKLQNEVNP